MARTGGKAGSGLVLPELKDKKLYDFRSFLWLVWRYLNLPDPTPVQYDIAEYLQYGPRRKIIEGFRGVGKSWITSAYVVWRLRIDPQLNFLVASASKVRADDFSTFTLMLINTIPMLQCLAPQPGQRNSKIAFDVAPAQADHAPSVKSVGIFGQLAGSRADEIIADDVEIPNNSMTQQMRDRLSEAVKEFDAIIKPGGRITYLGTPQTEQSLYNVLPERGYATRIWPVRFPESPEEAALKYSDKLAPRIQKVIDDHVLLQDMKGKPTDPARFGELELLEREASYGRGGFALQFMLDTTVSDADRFPLKLRDLIVMGVNPEEAPEKVVWGSEKVIEDLPCVGLSGDRYVGPMHVSETWLPYTASCMVIDPAGRGADETAFAVGKMLNSQIFVTEAGGLRDSRGNGGGYSEDVLNKLVQIAKRNKVNAVVIESNFGDGMFTELIKPYFMKNEYPCHVEEVRHNVQKERRIIDTLEPVMNQHRLIVDRSVVERDFNMALKDVDAGKYQLFYQMSHITQDRGSLGHDDRLDALAMLVGYFVKCMGQDIDRQVEARKLRELNEELRVFMSQGRLKTRAVFGDGANNSEEMRLSMGAAVVLKTGDATADGSYSRGRRGGRGKAWVRFAS